MSTPLASSISVRLKIEARSPLPWTSTGIQLHSGSVVGILMKSRGDLDELSDGPASLIHHTVIDPERIVICGSIRYSTPHNTGRAGRRLWATSTDGI
jgi:hypothetical protein